MNMTVSATNWLMAFLPLLFLLALMLGRKWGVAEAGSVAWLAAAATAWFFFDTPAEVIGYETVKGTWSAAKVLYVVWASILIYEVTNEGGAFEPLRQGITRILPDPLMQVLAFGWAFASFLQGVTGFGVPIAVCAPLLVGIGVRPLYAVIIPLVGHAWNNTFGTLAVAWLGLSQATDMSPALATDTAFYAAIFTWVLNFFGGLLVCWVYGKSSGVRKGLPAILVLSALQGGLTLVLAQWNPTLTGFIASTVAFIALFFVAKLSGYRHAKPADSIIFEDSVRQGKGIAPAPHPTSSGERTAAAPSMTLNQAFIPYYALLIITFGILLIAPVKAALATFSISLSFPETVTGLGFVQAASRASFAPLIDAGTFLLLAAIVGYISFAMMGCMRSGSMGRVLYNTLDKAIPSTVAVIALIAMSNIMAGSGSVFVLAQGVAAVTGTGYGFLAPLVGGLGSFMTTSALASNILFGGFQLSTADAIGLKSSAILGAQTAGAAAGNMIAPGNVLLGTTTAGILGREGEVLKVTIPLFMIVAVIIGVIVFFVA
ncbi:Putative lactate permease [Herminiimonas arsenicoxydans]|uniref:L-lactate permease n=1 Tax=Herminiimonas arsenicoxydans TaxID=204773 RepID=A4G7X6_HERAR|nr:Putative lactate permease [Herminiimonas arsenicoxydans]